MFKLNDETIFRITCSVITIIGIILYKDSIYKQKKDNGFSKTKTENR